jgi:hypothetical protein
MTKPQDNNQRPTKLKIPDHWKKSEQPGTTIAIIGYPKPRKNKNENVKQGRTLLGAT